MKRILLPLLILSVFAASMSAQRGNNIDARKLQGCFNPRICKRCDSMFVKSFIDDTFKL